MRTRRSVPTLGKGTIPFSSIPTRKARDVQEVGCLLGRQFRVRAERRDAAAGRDVPEDGPIGAGSSMASRLCAPVMLGVKT